MGKHALYMDIDYHDLCWLGDGGPEQLTRLFDQMAEQGFSGASIDCFLGGTPFFECEGFELFNNRLRAHGSDMLARQIRRYNPLAYCLQLAKECNMQLLPYLRLTDDCWAPNHGNAFFRKHPDYFLLSRCQNYILYGAPCFNYPEVQEHFLARCEALMRLGFGGILFEASRTHVFAFTPWVGKDLLDIWGFNPPTVAEYARRTGVDLTKIGESNDMDAPVFADWFPPQRGIEYIGCEPCDFSLLRRIHGEGIETVFREFRRRHPEARVVIDTDPSAMLPGEHPEGCYALYDWNAWVDEGLVNSVMTSRNWQGNAASADEILAKYPSKGRISKGIWLNDILTVNGGGGKTVSLEEMNRYVEGIVPSQAEYFVVHEAAFIENHPQKDGVWQCLGRLRGN